MIEALDIQVKGIVQGVGFRPFVYRLAKKYLINGWVLNATDGVFIHAEGEATLTLDKVNFQLPTGTALTVASGTVTLQNNTYNALLSGTHALRVETGATCLISPPADPDNTLALTAAEQASILAEIGTYGGTVFLEWITGVRTLDDASWQEYVDTCNQLGAERALELEKTAVERYNSI